MKSKADKRAEAARQNVRDKRKAKAIQDKKAIEHYEKEKNSKEITGDSKGKTSAAERQWRGN